MESLNEGSKILDVVRFGDGSILQTYSKIKILIKWERYLMGKKLVQGTITLTVSKLVDENEVEQVLTDLHTLNVDMHQINIDSISGNPYMLDVQDLDVNWEAITDEEETA